MANELQVTSRKTLTSGQRLSDKLTALVMGTESPVVGPNTAKALREFSEQPEPPLPRREQVETMIGKLAIATAQPKVSQAEAGARLELYWLALRDIPLDDLRAGFIELVRTSTFLPTPAQVRKAAMHAGSPRIHAKSRARYLAMLHDWEWKPPLIDEADPKQVKDCLAKHG